MPKQPEDLTNTAVSEWSVLRRSERRQGYLRYWHCRCSCGTEREVRGDLLSKARRGVKGGSNSCGCKHPCRQYGEGHIGWRGCGKIPMLVWRRIQRSAAVRRIRFAVTIEEAWDIYSRQGGLCAISGLPIEFGNKNKETTASLDRIRSDMPYTADNVQWVDKRINIMKSDLPQDEFVMLCGIVSGRAATKHAC